MLDRAAAVLAVNVNNAGRVRHIADAWTREKTQMRPTAAASQ